MLVLAALAAFAQDDVQVVVPIDGPALVNGAPSTDLRATFDLIRAADPEARIAVSADAAAPFARVVDVLDEARAAGLASFAITVAPTPEAEPAELVKPRRHNLPQNPYSSTDFTAYTLEGGETRIGLASVSHGLTPRVQIGTIPVFDMVGVPNINAKANLLREGRFDAAIIGSTYFVPLNQVVRGFLNNGNRSRANLVYTELGGTGSIQIVDPWSIHGGMRYRRVAGTGNWDFWHLPAIIAPAAQHRNSDVEIVTGIAAELVTVNLATDIRFNQRDSLALQFATPVYGSVRGRIRTENAGLDGLAAIIQYSRPVPVKLAYVWSLSWQFSWRNVDLRFGFGDAGVPGSWLIQAFDLSYHFGGETRRDYREAKQTWRDRPDPR